VSIGGTEIRLRTLSGTNHIKRGGFPMGRGILLWLLGVPIPVIILILLFWR
jgi:hypothetical protein